MAGKKPVPRTQEQISQDALEVYRNPDTGVAMGSLEPLDTSKNRENQISRAGDKVTGFDIGLEDIDEAIFYYFNNVIKPQAVQNEVLKAVPVLYASPEGWHAVQKEGFYRDKNGKMQMPVILLKRTSLEKRRDLGNKMDANFPRNYIVTGDSYSSRNRYSRFDLVNNRVPEREIFMTVIPDYIKLSYECTIITDYIEQNNKLIEAINFASDSYWGDPKKYNFNTRIGQYNTIISAAQGADRIVRTTCTLSVHGYVVPTSVNALPFNRKKTFTKVAIKIQESVESLN